MIPCTYSIRYVSMFSKIFTIIASLIEVIPIKRPKRPEPQGRRTADKIREKIRGRQS